jgi:hypothetical protein
MMTTRRANESSQEYSRNTVETILSGGSYDIALFLTLILIVLLPANSLFSSVFAQPLIHGPKTNRPSTTSFTPTFSLRNDTISIHTKNTIQADNLNILKQERSLRKVVLSNKDDAIFIAKGGVKNTIPVIVNAKIINQLANNRVDTTQGLYMTKSILAKELANAINTIQSLNSQQPAKVVVDNQAICSGIATSTSAACDFTISILG